MWQWIKEKVYISAQEFSEKLQSWFSAECSHQESLEDLLLEADFGLEASSTLAAYISKQKPKNFLHAKQLLSARLEVLLKPYEARLDMHQACAAHPWVVLVLGVNGAGKTTFLGKLAHRWKTQNVRCVAADTFRAGAQAQLKIWAQRSKADITEAELPKVDLALNKEPSSSGRIQVNYYKDPGSIVYQGLQDAQRHNNGIILIDTAGRLPHRSDLMDELKKIHSVITKYYRDKPHTLKSVLVLDGTTGHHMTTQVSSFQNILPLSGLVINKMDGTARAGMVISLTQAFKLPLYGIGIGEGLEDLYDFDAKAFSSHMLCI
ncbi:signal recognition particle-docking protein FtsY [Holospora curviuscula]|uniref:Signal recognition particle receptor FtsY n=1 Tax=Holospora curviuscula TaxID=1082868 RepID=A0A2S5R753_9PROT|nr:signal recognition particle-docking protein FtsY [Holospora curviuscula]PPE03169.1 Signal recognition particle receptor FtsY [Holospora curviuscula]